jgi:pimeloyl-ACP methyl ester carboxylesterase
MNNLRNPSIVPRRALALVLCLGAAGSSYGATRHHSPIESFCLDGGGSSQQVETLETRLAQVPALLRAPPHVSKPPILLWHGFGPPASERALMEALPLDDVPALKVYLGLPLFGPRQSAGGREEMVRRQNEDLGRLVFEPVVVGAARELPDIIAALQDSGCLRPGQKVGLFGFSAGGAAVLFALAEGKAPIETAVVVNASTGLTASVQAYEGATKQQYKWSDYTRDLARRTDAVQRAADIAHNRPALLIVQGSDDAMLGARNATALRDALVPFYKSARDELRLRLTLVDGLAHGWVDSPHAGEVRRSIAAWFNASY